MSVYGMNNGIFHVTNFRIFVSIMPFLLVSRPGFHQPTQLLPIPPSPLVGHGTSSHGQAYLRTTRQLGYATLYGGTTVHVRNVVPSLSRLRHRWPAPSWLTSSVCTQPLGRGRSRCNAPTWPPGWCGRRSHWTRPKGVFLVAYEATSFPYRGTALPLSYRTGHTERRYNTASGFTNWWT